MNQKDFKKRIKLLSKIDCRKSKTKKFMLECNDLTIHGICELCYNILRKEREIPLNKQTIKKLEPLRQILHKLSNPKGSIKKKREILSEISEDFFPKIKKSILPALSKLYIRNSK